MNLHFGFSYIGLLFLLMLIIPNIIWSKISFRRLWKKSMAYHSSYFIGNRAYWNPSLSQKRN